MAFKVLVDPFARISAFPGGATLLMTGVGLWRRLIAQAGCTALALGALPLEDV